jgi:hypothetical protein
MSQIAGGQNANRTEIGRWAGGAVKERRLNALKFDPHRPITHYRVPCARGAIRTLQVSKSHYVNRSHFSSASGELSAQRRNAEATGEASACASSRAGCRSSSGIERNRCH